MRALQKFQRIDDEGHDDDSDDNGEHQPGYKPECLEVSAKSEGPDALPRSVLQGRAVSLLAVLLTQSCHLFCCSMPGHTPMRSAHVPSYRFIQH